jgi:carbon-monoxide dehydrogenase large subunit
VASRLTGQSIDRVEDGRFLTGRGRFLANVTMPGVLHAVFVRSTVAHARFTVEAAAARLAPGVVSVFTLRELQGVLTGPITIMGPPSLKTAPYWPLADEIARFVGDPLAIVVADSQGSAEDAAALVEVAYEPLVPVTSLAEALDPSIAPLWAEHGTNVVFESHDSWGDVTAAFADAAHIVSRRYSQHRYLHAPLETRAAIADWSRQTGQFTYQMANKRPHPLKMSISTYLGIAYPDVHVRCGDIGGAFGSKGQTTREDIALAATAKLLARPVRWVEDRTENLQAAGQAREEDVEISAAVDAEGHIRGLRAHLFLDSGAYPMLPFPQSLFPAMIKMLLPNALRLDAYEFASTVVASNKGSYIAYRAPWTVETVVRERLLDDIARELDLAPDELRRRNLVTAAEQPTRMVTGVSLNGVTVQACLDRAVAELDLAALRVEQQRLRDEGRYLGIGLCSFIEIAPGPPDFAKALGFDLPSETATARIEPTGDLVISTWQISHGQGHETTLAQIAADEMGVPMNRVRIVFGDSDTTPFNTMSTGGSRSSTMGAGAVMTATRGVKQQVLAIAAKMLEANPDDLEIVEGQISVRGTPTRAVGVAEVARLAWFAPSQLPTGQRQGLETSADFAVPPDGGWVSACHACVVEVDVETGRIDIRRFLVVEDCGDLINPQIVDGQIRGGVAQGIASVLYEKLEYDTDGQLRNASFADYLVPAACDLPDVEIVHMHGPVTHEVNSRGVGEGGLLGAPGAVLNAVADALAPLGVQINGTYLPPNVVRSLVERATATGH